MNETEHIIMGVFAFLLGWFIGYFVKNIGRIWVRWGAIIGFFIIYVVFISAIMSASVIADMGNIIISSLFAIGFLIRFFKQRLES